MGARIEQRDTANRLDRDSLLSALGIGFLWSWVYCAYNTPSLFDERTGNSSLAHPSWLAAIAGAILVLVVGAVLFNRLHGAWRGSKRVAAGLMAVGTTISAWPSDLALSMLGGLASGIGNGLLWLFWGRVLVSVHSERTEYIIPASSIVTAVAALIYPSMSGTVGTVATAALPLPSLGCLTLVQNHEVHVPDAPGETDIPRSPMPARNILCVIAYTMSLYFVIGCLSSLSPLSETPVGPFVVSAPVFLDSCLGVLLALLCILHAVRIDLASLSKVIAPLLMGAIVLFAAGTPLAGQLFIVLLAGVDFMATAVIIVYLINLEKSGRLKGYSGIGIAQAALLIGSATGNMFGGQWHNGNTFTSTQLLPIVLVLACALVLSLSFVPRGTMPAPQIPKTTIPNRRERDLTEIIQALAAARGLTPRETEILEYLARGRTEPYIREQLWLSRSTVSTHVKHIYQKLNIHSKQEIISLIEGEQ
ncbi:LuxR family transcriptional regulator [Eggerthellaceae bacterium 24-137]